MKLTALLLSLSLTSLSLSSAHAFSLNDVAKGADAITKGSSGSADLLSMGTDLFKSFKGNDQAMSAAKGLMNAFSAEDYLGSFKYYDLIAKADLTPSQLATWNDVKNPLSALVLERKFNFKDSGLSDLVSKASSALQGNDTKSAGNYLSQLKDAATLTSGQKNLLKEISANLPLIK
ncbi:MAG: hypothetical protein ACPGJU_09685 [Coraliomargarita sp.]